MQNTPIRIEAEDYQTYFDTSAGNSGGQYRSNDVDIGKTGDIGGGFSVGWIVQGESLSYDVTVPASGTYTLVARVSSKLDNNQLKFSLDQSTEILSFDASDDAQGEWQDVVVEGINLNAGQQQLRLDMLSTGFNLNYIDLIPAETPDVGDNTNDSEEDMAVTEGETVAPTDNNRADEARDVIKQPFAADSIWNTSIGSEAEYVDANIDRAQGARADVDPMALT